MLQLSHTVKPLNIGHLQSVEFVRYPRYVLFKGKEIYKYTKTSEIVCYSEVKKT